MYQVPSVIGRYEVKTVIGVGGMGALYLARDTNPNTNRLVALKLLNATLDSRELRERFAREARALAALNHPNIVDIHDSGEFQGSPFIVMEYVRGETLAEKIKRKAPMSLAQKLALMVELCSGLRHAHDAGIIHRDIKPANLMVDQEGRLKVLDFGIARVAEGTRFGTMTQINVRIGTPGYMSPEQIEGGKIDRRSDIFAAGVVCYELLANREAFTGTNTRQIENNVLGAHPPHLSSLVPDLDPAVAEIVHKALAKDPADRFQDAGAFEEALERQRWKLGPARPVTPARVTPSPLRDSGSRARDSRAEAAYQRSLAVYEQGAVEAARRFAIEALAEDPEHEDARAFIDRLGVDVWPPPPPRPLRTTGAATVLATSSRDAGDYDPAGATVLSTSTPPAAPVQARSAVEVPGRRGGALQVVGIVLGVLLVAGVAGALAVVFWPRKSLLTIERPTGGTVWAAGITCGTRDTDCTTNVPDGEQVQLRGYPDEGFTFAGFGGECIKTGSVQLNGPKTCTALFEPLPKASEPKAVTWPLTISKPEHGTIVAAGGISCGSLDDACSVQFPGDQRVTLSAYPDPDYVLRGFTLDCAADPTIVMNAARTCGALFEREPKVAANPPAPRREKPAEKAPGRKTNTSRPDRGVAETDPLEGKADPIDAKTGGGARGAPKRIRSATKIKDVEPRYPEAAKTAGVEGTVKLELVVGRDGRVQDVVVFDSIPLLNQAAIDAAKQWRFEPTVENGVAIPVTFLADVRFTLPTALPTPTPAPAPPPSPAPAPPTPPAGGSGIRRTKSVDPIYPQEAIDAGVSGTVRLLVTVGPDGRVKEAKVTQSIPLLDKAAVDAVMQWEYEPNVQNGVAVPMTISVSVTFGRPGQSDTLPF